jgi:peptidoglycan/xylan/chitin deacetylase (PgdA/CDA1 family)
MARLSRLNLVFHEIVRTRAELDSPYAVTYAGFRSIIHAVERGMNKPGGVWTTARIYFDDNHQSAKEAILSSQWSSRISVVVAVPIDSIGKRDCNSYDDLFSLYRHGVEIVPHGYSHTALAFPSATGLQSTPKNGDYQNSAAGKHILPANQVLFQLLESKHALWQFQPREFVLPYGLYNCDTIKINGRFRIYRYLTTCEPKLDCGQRIRPRFLVTEASPPRRFVIGIERALAA